jgi:hypothetical protein
VIGLANAGRIPTVSEGRKWLETYDHVDSEETSLHSRNSTESSFLARVEAPSFGDPASSYASLCGRGEPTLSS